MPIYHFEASLNQPDTPRWATTGSFLVCVPDDETWMWTSSTTANPVLIELAWRREHIWIIDLQTGQGTAIEHNKDLAAQLRSATIQTCVLFGPFSSWLHNQQLDQLGALPRHVQLDKLVEAPERIGTKARSTG